LKQFDERTWQCELAPIEKQRALASLDESTLRALFEKFSTINDDLRSHIAGRIAGGAAPGTGPRPAGPCLLGRTAAEAVTVTIPSDVNEEVRRLLMASADLQRGGEARKQAIGTVLALLQSYSSKSDWAVGHYASLAVGASIASGDVRRAGEILSLARRLRPEDAQLGFLQRVIVGRSEMYATLTN